jgi:hypothetical protein
MRKYCSSPNQLILSAIICLFACSGFTQNAILISNIDSRRLEINSKCYAISVHNNVVRPVDSIWKDFQFHRFKPLNEVFNKPYFQIGQYDMWIMFIFKNDTKSAIPIFLKAKHEPLHVYKIESNLRERVRFLGHAATYDPSGLLQIKERNGFTLKVPAQVTDTVLMHMKIIEAGESKALLLYNADQYNDSRLNEFQISTLFNSILLGILLMLFIGTYYFYRKIKEIFLIWYMCYLIVFIIYYWRDLEFWNTQLDVSHSYLSWFATKTPITLLIFLFYLLFINSILKYQRVDQFKEFIRSLFLILPALWVLDIILLCIYPIGSICLAYSSGLIMGIIQMAFLYPIWKHNHQDSTIKYLIFGSVSLFGGWLTILFFPENIHQYTVRILTLLELGFFMLAITERFIKIKTETIDHQLLSEQSIVVERERINGEIHQEIGNTLKDVILNVNRANVLLHSQQKASAYLALDHINHSTSQTVSKLSDIIWCLNPRHDKIESLIFRLHDKFRRDEKYLKRNVTIINNLDPGYPLLTNIRKQIYDLCLNVFSALDSCNYQTLELSFTEIASGIQVEINARDINFGQRINDISIKLHNIITKEPVNGEVIRVKSIKLEEKWISIVLS